MFHNFGIAYWGIHNNLKRKRFKFYTSFLRSSEALHVTGWTVLMKSNGLVQGSNLWQPVLRRPRFGVFIQLSSIELTIA